MLSRHPLVLRVVAAIAVSASVIAGFTATPSISQMIWLVVAITSAGYQASISNKKICLR
jgi:hypothetical protein